jgi:hypothetical protein
MYEFEKHPKLTEFIQEMANTGKAPKEWTGFIETLNQALRIHDVVGRSEQLSCDTCIFNTHSWSEEYPCATCCSFDKHQAT